jgi:hypothetical protein
MADAVIMMALASRDAANRKELSRGGRSLIYRWNETKMVKPPLAFRWWTSGGEFN